MTHTTKFIQDAIEGGWRVSDVEFVSTWHREWAQANTAEMLLDPSAWKAVGIARGNKDEMRCDSPKCDTVQCEYAGYKDPRRQFISFMERVWEGKTIEGALAEI